MWMRLSSEWLSGSGAVGNSEDAIPLAGDAISIRRYAFGHIRGRHAEQARKSRNKYHFMQGRARELH
jgi:hypothetical protein